MAVSLLHLGIGVAVWLLLVAGGLSIFVGRGHGTSYNGDNPGEKYPRRRL